jgi:hydrogenase maturation protease
MDGGYAAVIVVDAVERYAEPGTLVVLDPRVPALGTPTFDEWLDQLSDMHLAEPSRILRIAQAAGVLPAKAVVVGCGNSSPNSATPPAVMDDARTR